ncbi:hypothetical protein HQ544_00325 [Candidatus Falkowbacteria bacterium]|nr:hypothetical protein [Candidatus Falkowbacteria bacterium]
MDTKNSCINSRKFARLAEDELQRVETGGKLACLVEDLESHREEQGRKV